VVVIAKRFTLKHELRNDPMEFGSGITKALLAGAESFEIGSGSRDGLVV
jgi:hypothetical protein